MTLHRTQNSFFQLGKIKTIVLTTGMAIGGTIASGSGCPASAFSLFFDEDVNANSNASAIPNSQAAETAFLGNLTGFQTEGFESFTPGFNNNLAIAGATITSSSATSGVSGMPVNGRFPVSGSKYYEVGTAGGSTTTTITFANPIAAFGFYATDIENPEGITLQLNNIANTLLPITRTTNAATSGSALYYGFVAQNPSETFSSITFKLASVPPLKQNDRFGIDNLRFATEAQLKSSATAVPEPLTIIGTLIGSAAAFQLKKRLQHHNKL